MTSLSYALGLCRMLEEKIGEKFQVVQMSDSMQTQGVLQLLQWLLASLFCSYIIYIGTENSVVYIKFL